MACPSPACHDTRSSAALCRACQDALARCLRELPALYEACELVLGGVRTPNEKVSGSKRNPNMPFNTASADARTSIVAIAASWSALVAAERGLPAPPREVVALSRFLGTHVAWLAGHPAAADALEEITDVARTARRAAEPGHVRVIPLGRCVHAGCRGTLKAVVRPDTVAVIRCGADETHTWRTDQWRKLGRKLWYTAAEIAEIWNLAPGSIYRLASERQWRRQKNAGRVLYYHADVDHTLRLSS